MPLNLPPEAQKAERRYRDTRDPDERIEALQEFMRLVPKHKGTDHLRADLRRKLAQLQDSRQKKGGRSRQESVYHIDPVGAGQVAVVGLANVGKSALVATLTNADPQVSPSPYSTWEPTPGMMPVEDIHIQLIDTPPLSGDYIEPDLIGLLRRADMLLLMVDVQTTPLQQIEETMALLAEHHIAPERHRERYAEEEARPIAFAPMLLVVNKVDDDEAVEVYELMGELLDEEWPRVAISAETGRGLDDLKRAVFQALEIVRIYSKKPNAKPDLEAPFVIKVGTTVEEFAGKVHRDFAVQLRAARVWGTGVYDGQMVGRDHVLHDRDIVELHL